MKRYTKSSGSPAQTESVERLSSELANANERIKVLESELTKEQESIQRLLAADVRSSEEVAELMQTIWQSHRRVHGGCKCDICGEVDQSRIELEGLSF